MTVGMAASFDGQSAGEHVCESAEGEERKDGRMEGVASEKRLGDGKVDDWDWELLYGFSNAKRRSSYCLHRSGIFYVAFCLIMTELARRLQ